MSAMGTPCSCSWRETPPLLSSPMSVMFAHCAEKRRTPRNFPELLPVPSFLAVAWAHTCRPLGLRPLSPHPPLFDQELLMDVV